MGSAYEVGATASRPRCGTPAAPPAAATAAAAPGATAGARPPARSFPAGSRRRRRPRPTSRRAAARRAARTSPRDGVTEPGGRHRGHTAPPPATLNARCGPGAAQRAQSVIAGAQPAWVIARSRNASSTSDGSRSRSGQRPDRADHQQVHPQRGLALLGDQPVRGLEDRAARGVARVVTDDAGAERVDGLRLGDDVQAATGVALHVDVVERLQPRTPPRSGAAHALRHRAHLAVRRVSRVTIRSASPSFCTRSTTPVSRYRATTRAYGPVPVRDVSVGALIETARGRGVHLASSHLTCQSPPCFAAALIHRNASGRGRSSPGSRPVRRRPRTS